MSVQEVPPSVEYCHWKVRPKSVDKPEAPKVSDAFAQPAEAEIVDVPAFGDPEQPAAAAHVRAICGLFPFVVDVAVPHALAPSTL